jgi:short-subunit dehydrogenase
LFAGDGWDVVLVARREAALRELADDFAARHRVAAHVVAADLADPAGPGRVAHEVAARGLAIEALVNNAGLGVWGHFAETTWRAERDLLAVNVVALTELTKRFLPDMLARRRGRILNIASTAAFQPGPLMAVYFASKVYVLHFSIALAVDLEGTGVTVTTLCPGPTETGFADAAGAKRSRLFAGGRGMEPAEVARAGYDALMAGRGLVVPGAWNKLLASTARFVPRSFAARVARRLAERAP